MTAQWIDVPAQGGSFKAFLATPPTGRGPGIVLIQEIFGVNAHIQAVAEQYALDGYTVLAPEVFWRQQPGVQLGYDAADFQRGIALMRSASFDQAVPDLAAAAQLLRGLPACTGRVAALGYCMGGNLAFRMAAAAKVDAAVCYYGGGIEGILGLAPQITAPILFHFAELDGFIPLSAVESVRAAFGGRDNAMVELYRGVDHGFNCWARGSYDQTASALARGRTLAFLATNLPG